MHCNSFAIMIMAICGCAIIHAIGVLGQTDCGNAGPDCLCTNTCEYPSDDGPS